jgi:hypothetical protein
MKINGETFEGLKTALLDTLAAHGLHPFMVKSTAQGWQVFHKAWSEGRLDGGALYKSHNDTHIETALKAIFGERGK